MKTVYAFLLFLIPAICALVSCNQPGEKLAHLWLFQNWSDSARAAAAGINNASFLYLNGDGSFTKDFPSFSHGKWKRAGDTLLLSVDSRHTTEYKMATDGNALRMELENGALVTFKSFPIDGNNEKENPFSLANNRWRVRAVKREGDAEILARMLNHVKYWEAYFRWAHTNNIGSIDVRTVPTPIKMYSNGFQVKPLDKLPRPWIRLFYDDQECARANQLLEYAVRRHRINFPKTENKFEMFISVFQQLHENISRDAATAKQ